MTKQEKLDVILNYKGVFLVHFGKSEEQDKLDELYDKSKKIPEQSDECIDYIYSLITTNG